VNPDDAPARPPIQTLRSRRELLRLGLTLLPTSLLLAACASPVAAGLAAAAMARADATPDPASAATPIPQSGAADQTAVTLPPTPQCVDGDDATLEQTEGPYFKPNSPERASLLEPGMAGTHLVVGGQVLTTHCQPVARALLEFWQADAAGSYDNSGFRLRGHQLADDSGRYRLETVVPGLYPGRTRHIHVKVQAPNQPTLTTQLYFPDEPQNARDGIFNPALVMAIQDAADGKLASFDFILNLA
jgi:protocatechuate 3,4-dioxygenase beta subunit